MHDATEISVRDTGLSIAFGHAFTLVLTAAEVQELADFYFSCESARDFAASQTGHRFGLGCLYDARCEVEGLMLRGEAGIFVVRGRVWAALQATLDTVFA